MKKLERLRQARDIACVLLVITTLLLSYQIWSILMGTSGIELLRTALGIEDTQTLYPGYQELSGAIRVITPLSCTVRQKEASSLYGTSDREEAEACFEKISVWLTQALETAQPTKTATPDQWRKALSGTMVCVDFGGQIQLSVLAQLLGTENDGYQGEYSRYLILSIDGERVLLFGQDGERQAVWAETDVKPEQLKAFCQEYKPNGYRYAWEENLTEAQDMVLLAEERLVPEMAAVDILDTTAESDKNRILEEILDAFDFNTYTTRTYRESDGTLVYVSEERTIRIGKDGWIVYYDPTADSGMKSEPDVTEKTARIAQSAGMILAIEEAFLGDAGLYLENASYDEETDLYTVSFNGELDGIRIVNERDALAKLSFRGTELVSAELLVRTFRRTGKTLTILPDYQAVRATDCYRDFALYYRVGKESVVCGWYIKEET